jgi:hypothetical protein
MIHRFDSSAAFDAAIASLEVHKKAQKIFAETLDMAVLKRELWYQATSLRV